MALIWIAACVVAYLFCCWIDQQPTSRDGAGIAHDFFSQGTQGSRSPSSSTLPPSPPRPTPDEVATAKLRWIDIKGRIEDLREDLTLASTEIEAWTMLVKQLPGNEAGRRIAGSKVHVEQYSALVEQPRQTPRLAGQYGDALKVYLETSQTHLGQTESATIPTAAMIQEIDGLKDGVRTLRMEYRRDRLALERLVSEAASVVPAELTLEQAIQQREKELASQYLAQLAAAKAVAEAESQRKLREAEQTAIKDKADAEAKQLREEADQQLKNLQQQAEIRKREEEAKRLRALAEDPEIQRKFSAFLQKGHLKFDSCPSGFLTCGPRPLPASFGDLSRNGWLRNVEDFARGMAKQPNRDYLVYNDRRTYASPRTVAEWDEMGRLLELFKTLGPVWVEMGLLEP